MPKRPPGVYVNGILGHLLRELDKLGTVKETAPLVGMTPEHLSYIRTGRVKKVPITEVERIANALGFTLKLERKSDALPPHILPRPSCPDSANPWLRRLRPRH